MQCANLKNMQLNTNHEADINKMLISIVSKSGYSFYKLEGLEKLELTYTSRNKDSYLVKRLFDSGLVIVASLTTLKVYNFKRQTEICSLRYSDTILSIKLNRSRMVVCTENDLFIHNIKDMDTLHKIRDTPRNPTGLCALSLGENNYLAYPGCSSEGEVQIFDTNNLIWKKLIHAHYSPLAALAFSPDGNKIATASEKGTIIRVFSVVDGSKLYEFTRGIMRNVSISNLVFSCCGSFLCSSSNTNTVHVFKLMEEPSNQSWMGYLSTYLPKVADVNNRAFATVHCPFSDVRKAISIVKINQELRVLVVTAEPEPMLFVYNVDSEGGVTLYKKIHMDESVDECSEPIPTDSADVVYLNITSCCNL